MKKNKIKNTISIICSVFGIIIGTIGLIVSLSSIGVTGLSGIGIIFIMPSIVALTIIIIDFLMTIDIIKKGLLYSIISSLIKIIAIIVMIPSAIYEYNYQMQYGLSNLDFYSLLIISLLIITIPSILNTIKFYRIKK